MANPHAIGNAFHITTDESMTWNQIYQTIADALGKPLNALHVASDFLAKHSDHYDFRGELLGDKAATVVFDNSKIKRLVPDFICHISMADGLRQAVHYMLSHPETQTPDPEFDSWCDRIANAISAATKLSDYKYLPLINCYFLGHGLHGLTRLFFSNDNPKDREIRA